jgi:hypothetical protein
VFEGYGTVPAKAIVKRQVLERMKMVL